MTGVRGSPAGCRSEPEPGSREHIYALKRQRWARGVDAYLRGGRLILRVEPTLETITETLTGEAS